MKQTAVEWFAEKIGHNSLMGSAEYYEILEQAKAMEKKQIIEARNNGFLASGEGWNGEYGIKDLEEIKSEQYYNETFK